MSENPSPITPGPGAKQINLGCWFGLVVHNIPKLLLQLREPLGVPAFAQRLETVHFLISSLSSISAWKASTNC